MATATATRTRAKHARNGLTLPVSLGQLQTVMDTPFGSIGIARLSRKGAHAARDSDLNSPAVAEALADDMRMMLIGRAFLLGTMQLFTGLMAAHGVPGAGTGTIHKAQRAPWGSKTGKRRRAKAK